MLFSCVSCLNKDALFSLSLLALRKAEREEEKRAREKNSSEVGRGQGHCSAFASFATLSIKIGC